MKEEKAGRMGTIEIRPISDMTAFVPQTWGGVFLSLNRNRISFHRSARKTANG
jgi:hypothetical protein